MEQEEDRELVEKAAGGDHRAFRALVERYQHKAYGIAYGVLRDPDQAMDVAQDAFAKVYKKLPEFEGRAKFYTWLYYQGIIFVNSNVSNNRVR